MASSASHTVYGTVDVQPPAGLGDANACVGALRPTEPGAGPPGASPGARVFQGRRSVDDIVGIARSIWDEINASGVARNDDSGNDRLYERLARDHQDFATSYPIVLRWMAQRRVFPEAVFRDYLVRFGSKASFANRGEFLDSQAEYLVLVHADALRKKGDHCNRQVLGEYRQAVCKRLRKDDEIFDKKVKDADVEVKKLDAEADKARRQRLYEHIMALRPVDKAAETASETAAETAAETAVADAV